MPPAMTLAGDTLGHHRQARCHNCSLPLSGPIFPSSLSSFTFSALLPRVPASQSGDGTSGSNSRPPLIRMHFFLILFPFLPCLADGNFPSPPAGSLPFPPRPDASACVRGQRSLAI